MNKERRESRVIPYATNNAVLYTTKSNSAFSGQHDLFLWDTEDRISRYVLKDPQTRREGGAVPV